MIVQFVFAERCSRVYRPPPDACARFTRTNISLVCLRWRAVIVEIPWIWTHIKFPAQASSLAPNWAKQALFLTRSKYAPIEVDIYGELAAGADGAARMASVIKTLQGHTHRLKVLHVRRSGRGQDPDASFEAISLLYEHIRTAHLPVLESLVLHANGTDFGERIAPLWESFQHGTPSLKELSLAHVPVDYRTPMFSGLTGLTLKDIRFRASFESSLLRFLVDFIRRSPNLTYIRLTTRYEQQFHEDGLLTPPEEIDPPATFTDDQPTVESDLETLIMDGRMQQVMPLLLRYVKLQKLEGIVDMTAEDDRPAFGLDRIPLLLQNPLSSLAKLRLRGISDPNPFLDDLPTMLSSMIKLEDLDLHEIEFTNEAIAALAGVCPSLTRLGLNNCLFPGFVDWAELVRVRLQNGIKALQELEVQPMRLSVDWILMSDDEVRAYRYLRENIHELICYWET